MVAEAEDPETEEEVQLPRGDSDVIIGCPDEETMIISRIEHTTGSTWLFDGGKRTTALLSCGLLPRPKLRNYSNLLTNPTVPPTQGAQSVASHQPERPHPGLHWAHDSDDLQH